MADGTQQAQGHATDAAAQAAEQVFGKGGPQQAPSPDRPDWALEKFWTKPEEYGQTLTTAYRELEKNYTASQQKLNGQDPVPESGSAYGAWLTDEVKAEHARLDLSDSGFMDRINAALHAGGVGPKAAEAIGRAILKAENDASPEVKTPEEARSAVIHELGPNGAAMQSQMATRIGSLARSGVLDAEDVKAIAPFMDTAAGARALHKLTVGKGAMPPDAPAAARETAGAKAKRLAGLKAELHPDNLRGKSEAELVDIQRQIDELTEGGVIGEGGMDTNPMRGLASGPGFPSSAMM